MFAVSGDSRGGPKTTVAVDHDALAALARDSVAGDARPTTQMDPAQMRELIGNAVMPIDELGRMKGTEKGMPPLTRPPANRPLSSSEIVELSADDRKSRKQRALDKPGMPRSTLVWIAILALVTVVALAGWLR